jgi:hypothetical protein
MTARTRLPNRRAHELIDFEHGGFRHIAGSRKTAYTLARGLRTGGFYSRPQRTWNCVADLVEHLVEVEARQ